ncbi:UTRA domain-containing protein [Pengzhenrongella phosphoraccumulans]|uniref:UTRA domain-containing protein n=1 Tax=Pengzhenrongella phosphoraccumulans TaxID=3114394 RepID=UPI0038903C08
MAAAEVDAQDADLLGLPVGRAVLRMTRRTFAGETACVYSRSSYRADRYVLWVPLRAPRRSITPQLTTQTAFQSPMTTAAHSLGSQPA